MKGRPAAVLLTALALAACGEERPQPTGPPAAAAEQAILRFERSAAASGTDEILTVSGLGHVTWREVTSGAVARIRISIDELLELERAFDDAGFGDLPATVRGASCTPCPTLVLTKGVGAGERSVTLVGDPSSGSPLARLVERVSLLAARAEAARLAALGGGGRAGDRLDSGLEVTLALGDATVRPGEPLYLQLTLANPTDRPIRLHLPTSRMVDFRITTVGGDSVWSLAGTRAALVVPNDLVLAPGESRTFEEVWMGRTSLGAAAERGSYQAVGIVTAGGETPPVAFQVR